MVTNNKLIQAIVFSVIGGALIGFLTHWSMTFNNHESSPKAECVYAMVNNPTHDGKLPECQYLSDDDKKDILGDLEYFFTVMFAQSVDS